MYIIQLRTFATKSGKIIKVKNRVSLWENIPCLYEECFLSKEKTTI